MSSREQETERIIREIESIFDGLEEKRGEAFTNTPVVKIVRHLAGVIARLTAVLPEPDPHVRAMVGARVLRESVGYIDEALQELRERKDGGEHGNT